MPIAQLSLFLDSSGQFRCEAPGRNGSRQKIDLPFDFAARNPEIMAALIEQQDEHRRKAEADLRALQLDNIRYVDAKHGSALVQRTWRNGEAVFNQRLKKHLQGLAGNFSSDQGSPGTSTKAAATPRQKKSDLVVHGPIDF